MRIVIADSRNDSIRQIIKHQPKNGLGLLVSFWYCMKNGKLTSIGKHLIDDVRSNIKDYELYIDSGVFTARKHNINIPWQDLAAFYREYPDVIDWIFNMDEGSHEQQLQNCKDMKAAGVPVIGIYHADMPLDYIDRFLEVNPYLAISFFKVGGTSGSGCLPYLDTIFNYVLKRYGKDKLPKLHALGTESYRLLGRYPFYSADSTGAANHYSYGSISKYNPLTKRIDAYRGVGSVEKKNVVKLAGISALGGLSKETAAINNRIYHAVKARAELNKDLTNLWIKRGINWKTMR